MVDVWELLGEIFGQPWEHNFGGASGRAIETWTRALACFSETQIRAAVDSLRGWNRPFPPNLGQFAEICRSYRSPAPPAELLKHDTRAPRKVAERELARMRAITRGESPETIDESLQALRRRR